jgi:hypothetical protein
MTTASILDRMGVFFALYFIFRLLLRVLEGLFFSSDAKSSSFALGWGMNVPPFSKICS